MAASLVNGDRLAGLKRIKVPTVVIHGADDPLVPIEAGRDTAANIAGAELVEILGTGHDLPAALFSRIVDAIESVAKRARVGSSLTIPKPTEDLRRRQIRRDRGSSPREPRPPSPAARSLSRAVRGQGRTLNVMRCSRRAGARTKFPSWTLLLRSPFTPPCPGPKTHSSHRLEQVGRRRARCRT